MIMGVQPLRLSRPGRSPAPWRKSLSLVP